MRRASYSQTTPEIIATLVRGGLRLVPLPVLIYRRSSSTAVRIPRFAPRPVDFNLKNSPKWTRPSARQMSCAGR